MKKNLLFTLGLFLIILTSCEYKYIDPIEVELTDISFSSQIEPVFQKKCVGCHATQRPVLTTGDAYDNLIDGNFVNTDAPESSRLYEKVSGGHYGGDNTLSPTEQAILLIWIQEGAVNN